MFSTDVNWPLSLLNYSSAVFSTDVKWPLSLLNYSSAVFSTEGKRRFYCYTPPLLCFLQKVNGRCHC